MKKLMFATALVASVAAFDDAPTAINAVGFEGYNLGETFGNGKGETNEAGTGNFFCFTGDAGVSNSSVVTNDSPSTKRTAFFAAAENTDKYLALDTEGGTFWRGLSTTVQTETPGEGGTTIYDYSLGAAQTIADTAIYLDTLVQFTVTEDDEPTVGNDDKLAIWLGVETNGLGEVTGTNLMVKAGLIDDQGGITETSFKINGTVNPGEWYRLTVKALADITDTEGVPGFQIYLDGNLLTSGTPTFTSDYLEILDTDSHYADIAAGKYFASLKTVATLQGVGFQGTGAVDEIVWTEDDLFPAGGPTVVDYTFTLTLDANVTGAEVTTNGAAVVFDNGEAQILAGTTVSIAEPTFAQGYKLNTITTNNVAVVDPQFPIAFTMDAAMAVAITSELIPVTYPTYVGDDATLRTKYDAWKDAYQADTQSQWESAFLLNMDPTASVAEGTALLKIASITEVSGGWELEIVSDATTLTATDGTVLVGNGYLRIIAADTLAGLTTATPSYINVAVTNGKITVTVPASNGKFMKAELTTQAPAQN